MIMKHNTMEEKENKIDSQFVPKNWERSDNIITIIGVGGGGSNAVNYMYAQNIPFVNFVVCNTDKKALEMSKVPTKIQLGQVLTRGLGAGTNPEVGKKAAKESIKEIEEALGAGTEMVFITCGMGGGTGTGAAPVVAEVAKNRGLLTVGVATIPFRDEGPEALYRAIEGIKEFNHHVDSLLIIDNEKLYEIYGNLNIFKAFPKADEVLAIAVKSIAEIITCGGYINMDFADVKMVMQNSGMALMGHGSASGPDRAIKAVEEAFSSPLLNDLDVSSAKNALVNITSSGEDGKALETAELSQIMDYIKKYTGHTSNFKRGVVRDDSIGENVSVTIVVTGFEMASLPVINEDDIVKNNTIEIKYDPIPFNSRKHGVPLHASGTSQIKRKERILGKPALIVDTIAEIEAMESETAYIRRERMLTEEKEQKDKN